MAGSLSREGTHRRSRRSLAAAMLTRAAGVVFVLWAVATATFFAIRLIPGDPAEAIVGGPGSQAGEEALERARAEHGLDQPLIVQYLRYLGRLGMGDLGTSYALRDEVVAIIARDIGGTLMLAGASLATAWALALALAAWSARSGRWAARVASLLDVTAAAVPNFWLAICLILIFSTTLGWLPPVSVPGPTGLILPALTLAIPLSGFLGQVMRESLLDAMASPFVLAARARGETEVGILWRHALRHAAIPAVGLSGWAFGALISGAVVVESVFARPGLGRTLLTAVQGRDVPLVLGVVLVVALAYMLVVTVTDALDRLIDPRLRTVS